MRKVFESRGLDLHQSRRVDQTKIQASNLLEELDKIIPGSESARLKQIAITCLEESVMWAVKAISREPLVVEPQKAED